MRSHVAVLVLLAVAGCASNDEVRPDDMSASAHRGEAAKDNALAAQHVSRYDPEARDVEMTQLPGSGGEWVPVSGNPTSDELARARALRAHARAHLEAAKALEAFEDAECKAIAPAERGACPLLGPVSLVENIPAGLRLTLAHAEMTSVVIARMRCHLAFARARAYDVPSCPLYVRGLEITAGEKPGTIELRGSTPAVIDEIRRRAPEELSIPGSPSAAR